MLLVEVRRLDIAPSADQFWTIVSRVNGPEFMGVLYRAREAIFDSAGIAFTIDLLNKFLQFDVTKSWSAADEGELFMGSAPVVGWLRVRRPGSATLRELRSDDIHFMELEHAAKPAFVEVGVAYRAGTEKVRTDFLKRIRTAAQEALGQEVGTPSSWPVLAPVGSHNFDAIRKNLRPGVRVKVCSTHVSFLPSWCCVAFSENTRDGSNRVISMSALIGFLRNTPCET